MTEMAELDDDFVLTKKKADPNDKPKKVMRPPQPKREMDDRSNSR